MSTKEDHLPTEYIPIENSGTKWTSGRRATKEEVPDSRGELGRLSIGSESRSTGRTSETDGHDLALGLASLDSRGQERAVGQLRAREYSVIVDVAGLDRRSAQVVSTRQSAGTHVGQIDRRQTSGTEESTRCSFKLRHDMWGVLRVAYTLRKAIGNASIESS